MAITNTIPKAVKRFKIADYYGLISGSGETATVSYELMGTGFEKIDESPNAQVDKVHYVNMVSASSDVSKYEPEFAYDSNIIASEKVIMDIYDIGTRQKTGEDAIRDYVRVELFRPYKPSEGTAESTEVFKARRFLCTVGVSSVSGNGGENIKVSGSLQPVEDAVDGYFNIKTKTFDTDPANLVSGS